MILKVSTVFRRKCGIYSQSEDLASIPDCCRLTVSQTKRFFNAMAFTVEV